MEQRQPIRFRDLVHRRLRSHAEGHQGLRCCLGRGIHLLRASDYYDEGLRHYEPL
jgi:hypothetical protein